MESRNDTNTELVRQQPMGAPAIHSSGAQSTALAAQAKAAVEARYLMAMGRPRDLPTVRVRLLAECRRPRFADDARYAVPRGRKRNEATGLWEDNIVEGPSIRFAEAAVRSMTNMVVEAMVVFDDESTRQVRVTATDLEANVTWPVDIMLAKTMERKKLNKNQVALGQRYNTSGELVYIVAATDDELTNRQAAAVSKAARTAILRLVPGDIVDECMDLCVATIAKAHKEDPTAAIKAICDGFAQRGVMPSDLVSYLGHPLDQMTAQEYTQLRQLWVALRDGQITWTSAMEQRLETRQANEAPAAAAAPADPPAPTSANQDAATATPAATPAAKPAEDKDKSTQPSI